MTKVLMVCLGNICRSPLAEGLLRAKVDAARVMVDSAGTAAYHIGEHPDRRMTATAAKHQIDISRLKGRQFSKQDFETFDYIYVMDRANYENVLQLASTEEEKQKVELILNLIDPGQNKEVPDPYFGGQEGFEKVFQLLDQCTDQIARQLK